MLTITNSIQYYIYTNISTIHFADDQVITSDSEDNLQTSIYKLNKITKYGLTISTDRSDDI
jgi:hypothetical protein